MNSNAPVFDPLNATAEERDDMRAGYSAACDDNPRPAITSAAFDHGWRMRRNDMVGIADEDQRVLARRLSRGLDEDGARLKLLQDDIARFRRGRAA